MAVQVMKDVLKLFEIMWLEQYVMISGAMKKLVSCVSVLATGEKNLQLSYGSKLVVWTKYTLRVQMNLEMDLCEYLTLK